MFIFVSNILLIDRKEYDSIKKNIEWTDKHAMGLQFHIPVALLADGHVACGTKAPGVGGGGWFAGDNRNANAGGFRNGR